MNRHFGKVFVSIITALQILPWQPAAAQSYKIEALGSIYSDSEQVIDVAGKGLILLNDTSGKKPCPIFYNLHSKTKLPLCALGLDGANAVNSRGTVAGWVMKGGKKKAAYWSRSGRAKRVKNSFAESELVDVNDNDEFVGTASFKGDVCSGKGDDRYCYEETRYRAFRYNRKNGFRQLRAKSYDSRAIGINNSGKAYLFENLKASGLLKIGFSEANGNFTSLPEIENNLVNIEYYKARINNSGQLLFLWGTETSLYSPRSGWRTLGVYSCDRCDYKDLLSLGDNGNAAVRSGQETFLSNYPKPVVNISCLVAQNRALANTPYLLPSNLSDISALGGFLSDGSLIFSGDISGDGKFEQLFKLVPLPVKERGLEYDLCQGISASTTDLNCNNDVDGSTCRFDFTIANQFGPLSGTTEIKLIARQYIGYENYISCAPEILRTITVNGGKGSVEFKYDKFFSYSLEFLESKFSGGAEIKYASESKNTTCLSPRR